MKTEESGAATKAPAAATLRRACGSEEMTTRSTRRPDITTGEESSSTRGA
jgi:hypothetical protein